ncbi:septum formation initiator family protein, partial [Streptococcus pneumoniae]|uniref:septum formation initiator family protein n=1 Tax=Streptococcus pneumoniae TaxID=1313 RepID=UPI0009918689
GSNKIIKNLRILPFLFFLQTQYQTLSDEKDKETAFATKLKDEDYAAKYTRAKYYYSKSREKVYTIPDLLQR